MNEMIDQTLGLIAPHICKGCGVSGAALCKRCEIHILSKKYMNCVICEAHLNAPDLLKRGNMCKKCFKATLFNGIYAVGLRRGNLRKLVGDFKYNSERGAAGKIVKLLDKILPKEIPTDMNVVPITTISKNVRLRGFDQMKLVGRKLAKKRRIPFSPNLLLRKNNSTQHNQASPVERRRNAAKSLAINPRAKVPQKILLLDDIYTTGATVETAAKLLRKNGAKEIWLLIVARQPSKK